MIKSWIEFGGYDMPKNIIIVKKYEKSAYWSWKCGVLLKLGNTDILS